eukprot:TRINITY_DN60320_c0_g1_i1.p1 TRINITY_DN60320_c0_g1~~TRINITY_DN60320_c0_g1_i1.p1  ORF type:complete len:947 (+),score=322.28 TRINITY_DN60320_c0_g1_i1:73-2841(+)
MFGPPPSDTLLLSTISSSEGSRSGSAYRRPHERNPSFSGGDTSPSPPRQRPPRRATLLSTRTRHPPSAAAASSAASLAPSVRSRLAPLPQLAAAPAASPSCVRRGGAGEPAPPLVAQLERYVEKELVALGVDEHTAVEAATGDAAAEEPLGQPSWGRVQVWESCLRQLARHLRPYGPLIDRALREFRWFLRRHNDTLSGGKAERQTRELAQAYALRQEELREQVMQRDRLLEQAAEAARQELDRYRRLAEVQEQEQQELRQRWYDDHKRTVVLSEALRERQEEGAESKIRLQQLDKQILRARTQEEQLAQTEQELDNQRQRLIREERRNRTLQAECSAHLVRLSVLEEQVKRLNRDLALVSARLQQSQADRQRYLVRTEQLAQELRAVREPALAAQAEGQSVLTPRPFWTSREMVDAFWNELTSRRSQGGAGHRQAQSGQQRQRAHSQAEDRADLAARVGTGTYSAEGEAPPPTSPLQGDAPEPPERAEKRWRLEQELVGRKSAENAALLATIVGRQRRAIANLHQQVHTSKKVSEFLKHDPIQLAAEDDPSPPPPAAVPRRPAQFFVGVGVDPKHPKYLQWNGKVPNRQLSREDLREWMSTFWQAKCGPEAQRQEPQDRPPFARFLYTHLGGEMQHLKAVEMAYNVLDAARKARGEVDCDLFVAVHEQQLGDAVCDMQYDLVDQLRQWFARCEKIDAAERTGAKVAGPGHLGLSSPGRVSKRVVNRELHSFFTEKRPDALLQLKVALHNEQPGRVIPWRRLFETQPGGAPGPFITLVRQQHLEEVRNLHEDIQQILIDASEDGVSIARGTLMDALQDGYFRQDAHRIAAKGLGADPDEQAEDVSISEFAARLRANYPGPHPVRRVAESEDSVHGKSGRRSTLHRKLPVAEPEPADGSPAASPTPQAVEPSSAPEQPVAAPG